MAGGCEMTVWLGRFHCAGCEHSRGPGICLECWEDEERAEVHYDRPTRGDDDERQGDHDEQA